MKPPSIIAMIHVAALPGTPTYEGSVELIVQKAVEEARLYQKLGVDCLLIENMHDVPYLRKEVGHEISSVMTRVALAVKQQTKLPCGIQILAGANKAALAVAHAAGLEFIRAEGFVFAHIGDEGFIQSDAAELLRYRKMIGADTVKIMTDIQKKHSSHAITADISITELAETATFFRSDGLVITGTSTGKATSLKDIQMVRQKVTIPIWVGSGINAENIRAYIPLVDGLIIGSAFKENGYWANKVDAKRVKVLLDQVHNMN